MTDTTCTNCRRTSSTPVCARCQDRAADQLAELAERLPQLDLAQIPGGTSHGEHIRHTKADSAPLPLRLDAFNLLSAGSLDAVDPLDAGDQSGVLPLRLWLTAWWDDWVVRLGLDTAAAPDSTAKAASPALARDLLTTAGKVTVRTVPLMGRVGLDDDGKPIKLQRVDANGRLMWRRLTATIIDTLDAEHAARFGRPDHAPILAIINGLANNLDRACDEHPGIGDFLTGLRAMVGACRAVVGEASDLAYLGRCPEVRRDKQTGAEEQCGGAIWQDPYVKLIACPRCRKEWKEREWLWLGRRIRDAEPAALHEFTAEMVVVMSKVEPPELPVEIDRYWLVSCTCGTLPDEDRIVHGNKLDARGVWRRHVRAAVPAAESGRLSA